MSELNLKCHFQMVRNKTQYGEEFTVHEAFSTDKGELYMLSPVPVYVMGDSKEDISELTTMIDKDIEHYGIVDIDTLAYQFDKFHEYSVTPTFTDVEVDEDRLNPEQELLEEDYHDTKGNVLDLVDFMKKRK